MMLINPFNIRIAWTKKTVSDIECLTGGMGEGAGGGGREPSSFPNYQQQKDHIKSRKIWSGRGARAIAPSVMSPNKNTKVVKCSGRSREVQLYMYMYVCNGLYLEQ